jgi:hypothetical protein
LEEAQSKLLEALTAHSIAIETQHAGTQYGTKFKFLSKIQGCLLNFAAKCSTALVEWGNFLGGIQKTFVRIVL